MKTNIVRVCQIGTTNYVDYKGERLTVEEHEKKHGVKLKIPKNVKVCEPEVIKLYTKRKAKEILAEREHGSRAKKEILTNGHFANKYGMWADQANDIDIPKNLRRVGMDTAHSGLVDATAYFWASSKEKKPKNYLFQAICIAIILASLIIHSLQQ